MLSQKQSVTVLLWKTRKKAILLHISSCLLLTFLITETSTIKKMSQSSFLDLIKSNMNNNNNASIPNSSRRKQLEEDEEGDD